jgi:hypothetical protein
MSTDEIFSKIERLKLIANCIKAVTAVFGGSLILAEGYPYLALIVLAIGGISNEIVSSLKEKENKKIINAENKG